MSEKENTGATPKITQKKLDNLYKLIQIYKTDAIVARALGVTINTFKSWISSGYEILSAHPRLQDELTDCMLDGDMKAYEMINIQREEFEQQFLEETGASEIHAKNKIYFDEFLNRKVKQAVEEVVCEEENKIIDNYDFGETEYVSNKYRLYAKVARTYDRANLALVKQYTGNIDKHAGSSKNVNLSKWFLEIKEDSFKQQPVKHTMTHEGTVSLVQLVSEELEAEKRQQKK